MSQPAPDEFTAYSHDPFGPTANPATYFGSGGSERARAGIEASVDAGRIAGLAGPPGHGKTLQLRLLEMREAPRSKVAYLPFPSLEVDDFFALVLERLGAPADAEPRAAFSRFVADQAARGGVLLLIDDAHALPPVTVKALAQEFDRAQGGLRLALAAVEGDTAFRVFQTFGNSIDVRTLDGSFTEPETRQYIETRLAYAGARPELVTAFDEETVARLHRNSRGVPRGLSSAAQDVVRLVAPGHLPRLRELQRPPKRADAAEGHVSLASLAERALGEGPVRSEPAAGEPSTETHRMARDTASATRDPQPRGRQARAPGPKPRASEDPTPAPGYESMAARKTVWSRGTAVAVFKWMAFGAGVGVTVMWLAGREALPPIPLEPYDPGRITPASEINQRARTPRLPDVVGTVPGREAPKPEIDLDKALAEIFAPDEGTEAIELPEAPVVEPLPAPANAIAVSINATPWATVEVDGRLLGETPLARVPLTPGPHDFRATMPDGSVREETVEISAQRRTVTFD